jgi:hypothetical protein
MSGTGGTMTGTGGTAGTTTTGGGTTTGMAAAAGTVPCRRRAPTAGGTATEEGHVTCIYDLFPGFFACLSKPWCFRHPSIHITCYPRTVNQITRLVCCLLLVYV